MKKHFNKNFVMTEKMKKYSNQVTNVGSVKNELMIKRKSKRSLSYNKKI